MRIMDLHQLYMWSELRPADWEKHRVAILGKFVFHPATGSLHDPSIQAHYREFAQLTLRKQDGGRKGANVRHNIANRKIGRATSGPIEPPSPYAGYTGDFWQINASTWPHICKIIEQFEQSLGVLKDSYSTPIGVPDTCVGVPSSSINNNKIINNSGTAPALPSGEGAGIVQPPPLVKTKREKEKIDEFMATHTDAELADIQQRWLHHPETSKFMREHYRGKNPRSTRSLADMLYTFFLDYNPSTFSTPAAPTTETPPAIAGESA